MGVLNVQRCKHHLRQFSVHSITIRLQIPQNRRCNDGIHKNIRIIPTKATHWIYYTFLFQNADFYDIKNNKMIICHNYKYKYNWHNQNREILARPSREQF
jgi:hypothetical protein